MSTLSVIYADCRNLPHYAEFRYAECCYAECRGALQYADGVLVWKWFKAGM